MNATFPNTTAAIIELERVKFQWPNNNQVTLDIEKLSVSAGEHLFIKGPSGCGKSTLLSLLTGIHVANQGQVRLLGHDLAQLKAQQRDRFRADHIGYIFQQFNLLPYLSLVENVILPCQFSLPRRKTIQGSLKHRA
ncbi:ATP-binding cassette domain-containing protein, partial [Vibrio sp. V26_P1S5P106]